MWYNIRSIKLSKSQQTVRVLFGDGIGLKALFLVPDKLR